MLGVVALLLAAVLVYTWLVYPSLIVLLGRRAAQGLCESKDGEEPLPDVVVLLSAYNEERVIQQRLENLDQVDYPPAKLRVLVGVDGGIDSTAAILQRWSTCHPRVQARISTGNRGKAAMLKWLITESELPGLDGDRAAMGPIPSGSRQTLLVFTDANTMFARDAIRRLASPFVDERVGGVCGRLVFRCVDPFCLEGNGADFREGTGRGQARETDEPVYWDAETKMKAAESVMDSCLGANGAIYAIRRELFPPDFCANTIVDDFVLGMKVREQGYRMRFEASAVAYEELPSTIQAEWRRRVRIGAGAYQALTMCWRCLLPRYGVFAWMFWSHKVLRWMTPHLSISLLAVGCGMLLEKPLWLWACSLGVACVAGSAGWCARKSRATWARPFRLVGYFLVMQVALFTGFLRFCRGHLSGAWERTERR